MESRACYVDNQRLEPVSGEYFDSDNEAVLGAADANRELAAGVRTGIYRHVGLSPVKTAA